MKSKDKLSWMGTIPLFVLILAFAAALFVGFFVLHYWWLAKYFSVWTSIIVGLVFAFISFLALLNLPIHRKFLNPFRDLDDKNKIAQGAWCSVYRKKDDATRVVKQLYYCGWGHNDYTKHKAPVFGKKKICGKWNPIILVFLHNYMILYQLIGLRRGKRFAHCIDALPKTYNINYLGLRFEQDYVLHELTVENCPSDIAEQFERMNKQLEECGLFIDDVHARNVRITEDGKVKVIDGELYSGGEEWIKSKLVVLVNGAMVSNMEKVLGNERIVAWVDHRERVDEVVREMVLRKNNVANEQLSD